MVDPNEDKGEREVMFGFREVREVRRPEEWSEISYQKPVVTKPEHTLEENLATCKRIVDNSGVLIPVPEEQNGIIILRKEIDRRRTENGKPELTMLEISSMIKEFFNYMSNGDMTNFANDMFEKFC
jgi:hypothetical protein